MRSQRGANYSPIIRLNSRIALCHMTRSYSFLVVSDDLLTSPFVRQFSTLHDLVLRPKESVEVNFLLQRKLYPYQLEQLFIKYNPDILDIKHINTELQTHQTIIQATVTPRQVGSLHIELSFPAERPQPIRQHLEAASGAQRSLLRYPYHVNQPTYA